MKLNLLNWRIGTLALVMGAGTFLGSCNNEDAANNSTNMETDTTMAPVTTPPMPDTSMTRTGKKSGKVSVAMDATKNTDKMAADKMGYYNYSEVSPSFKGGQTAIETFINNNIEYPQDAIDNNVEGTVRVQFGVDANGKISNVKTIGDKLGYGLEEEAIKVITSMPNWTPGMVSGKNVKTWMVLPVTYRIES